MLGFDKIAPYLQDPLILIGFFIFIGFLILRVLIKQGIIPTLTQRDGFSFLKILLLYGFLFGIILMGLGFGLKHKGMSVKEQNFVLNQLNSELNENLKNLDRIRKNTLRLSYPLFPVDIEYVKSYNTNDTVFFDYLQRITPILENYFGRTVDSFDFTVVLSTKNRSWMPIKTEKAFQIFSEDWIGFEISSPDSHTLEFISIPNYSTNAFKHRAPEYDYNQIIEEISIDFIERKIFKNVLVQNPLITNADALYISALDLVGRNLSWRPLLSGINAFNNFDIIQLTLNYPFARNKGNSLINYGDAYQNNIIIKPEHIGLKSLSEIIEME